jgi:hypothetical protein
VKPGAVGKPSLKRATSCVLQTRNQASYPWAGRSVDKTAWRPEPVNVEKLWDDLWVGAKNQPSLAIAGSPRNSFRASLERSAAEVEHWMG